MKELLGHRSILTTQVYLRRLDRGVAMERVRTLSWQQEQPQIPESADEPLASLLEAEKEGFEPSMEAFTPITP